MAATVRINEANGAGQTVTNNISNSNFGSTDAQSLVAATYPITAGTYSYEKWQKFEVTAMGGSSVIKDIKTWYTGTRETAKNLTRKIFRRTSCWSSRINRY